MAGSRRVFIIAYGDLRRLDRGPPRLRSGQAPSRAERPSPHDKPLIVERRSLRSAWSLPRAKSRGAPVETTAESALIPALERRFDRAEAREFTARLRARREIA